MKNNEMLFSTRCVVAHCCLALLILIGCNSSTPETSVKTNDDEVATQIESLIAGYEEDSDEFLLRVKKAKTREEQLDVVKTAPKPIPVAGKLMDLVNEFPGNKNAAKALVFVCVRASRNKLGAEAYEKLVTDHMDSSEIGEACFAISRNYDASQSEETLRSLSERSPHKRVRGLAAFALAKQLQRQNDGRDEESILLFGLVVENSDQLILDGTDLVEVSKLALFQLKDLGIGRVAPDIVGEDLDGVEFKLSDYRGQVVLLDFWGHW